MFSHVFEPVQANTYTSILAREQYKSNSWELHAACHKKYNPHYLVNQVCLVFLEGLGEEIHVYDQDIDMIC